MNNLVEDVVDTVRETDAEHNLSAEEVDSDDLAGSLNASDDEDGEERRALYKAAKSDARSEFALSANQPQNAQNSKPSSYYQEFDTNVFVLTWNAIYCS